MLKLPGNGVFKFHLIDKDEETVVIMVGMSGMTILEGGQFADIIKMGLPGGSVVKKVHL